MSLPSSASIQSPALTVFVSHLSDSLHRLLSKQRPWPELITPAAAFSRPISFSEAASRLLRNAAYFRINYTILLGCVLAVSLVSHPTSLLCLVLLCFAWIALYAFRPPERSLTVLGRAFSRNEVLGMLLAATALVLLFTSVGSVLVHAALVGVALVCAHAAFRCPIQDLFSDDHNNNGTSYSTAAPFFSPAGANGLKRSPTTPVSCV